MFFCLIYISKDTYFRFGWVRHINHKVACFCLRFFLFFLIDNLMFVFLLSMESVIFLIFQYQPFFRTIYLTLSLLRYLKTRIRWGGVNLTPPSKSHVWSPNMTNDTSLESSCALLLESAKKFANLQKLNFLSQNPVI